jgi:hypothetical protein
MAKPFRTQHSFKALKKNSKKVRPAYLAVIGLVVISGAYAATTVDLAYTTQSLMAAALSLVDSTPKIVVQTNEASPTTGIWPTPNRLVRAFDIYSQNVSGTTYITNFPVNAYVTSPSLQVGEYTVMYEYCDSTSCKAAPVPSTLTPGGLLSLEGSLAVHPHPIKRSTLRIYASPYYKTVYNVVGAPVVGISAAVGEVAAARVAKPTLDSQKLPVLKILKQPTLPVLRGTGFGYGYWDLNSNNNLAKDDADIVLRVATNLASCPRFKLCDINNSGGTPDTADVSKLLRYAEGTIPPPTTPAIIAALNGSPTTECRSYSSTTGKCSSRKYTIPFTVTAGDKDIFVGRNVLPGQAATFALTPNGSNRGLTYATTLTSTPGVADVPDHTGFVPDGSIGGGGASGGTYIVHANTSRAFGFYIYDVNAIGTGNTGIRFTGINYSFTSTMGDLYYTANLGTLKTPDAYMTR